MYFLLAQTPAPSGTSSLLSFLPVLLIFGIFYFVLILPMRRKQKKLEELVKGLKSGDRVVLSSGIFGTITGTEDDAFLVRIDDKTRIKVLKSAVAGLQAPSADKTEK